MSAFAVSKAHVDALVTAGIRRFTWYPRPPTFV